MPTISMFLGIVIRMKMPTISMFLGIVIRMNWIEHNPPHFHAEYQGHRAVFDLDGNLTHGEMPVKQSKLISAWAVLHADVIRRIFTPNIRDTGQCSIWMEISLTEKCL